MYKVKGVIQDENMYTKNITHRYYIRNVEGNRIRLKDVESSKWLDGKELYNECITLKYFIYIIRTQIENSISSGNENDALYYLEILRDKPLNKKGMKKTGIAKFIAALGKENPNSVVTQVALLIRKEWTERIKKEKKVRYEEVPDDDDEVILKKHKIKQNNEEENQTNEKEDDDGNKEIDRRVELDDLPDREMIRVKIFPITVYF